MTEQPDDGFDWGGWLLPGAALLVAAAALVFTLMPRDEQSPAASSPPSASARDEHEVVTDEGTVSFRLEDDAMVVRLATGTGTTELGRARLPFMTTPPPGGTRAPTGTAMFVMVCGPAGTPAARRYVLGHLDQGEAAEYSGPEAVGHGASDGLFLFALLPGAASGPVEVRASDGSSAGFGGDAFGDAATEGTPQPSGCFVGG